MPVSSPTDFYLNQSQFSDMKLGARNQSGETTKAVAQQFESLFVQQMLASMRSAATVDEASHSSTIDFYQEMYDKQLALSISKQGGLGIAKVLMQQLPGGDQMPLDAGKDGKSLPIDLTGKIESLTINSEQPAQPAQLSQLSQPAQLSQLSQLSQPAQLSQPIGNIAPSVFKTNSYQAQNPAVKVNKFQTEDLPVAKSDNESHQEIGSIQRWSKPEQYINDIFPHVEQAANIIGISAEALIAQSALETGWGKHSMRFPDGKSAFNLFGIKAGSNWNGPTLTKPTIEFQNGVMQTEIAHFRAYESIPDALDDYVNFIQSSARYQNALDHQGSDTHYLKQLQQGGYATDPEYANKIINIMQGKTLGDSLASLNGNQALAINVENNHA